MNVIQTIEQQFKKPAVVAVETGDTVRVHQRIREGSRERLQVFEGLVIRVDRRQSLTYRMTVRKIASGVGVEKGFMMHSPNVVKVEVTKRARVRRNYISYIRRLTGKSARLKARPFDPAAVNLPPPAAEARKTKSPADDPEPAAGQPAGGSGPEDKSETAPATPPAAASDDDDSAGKEKPAGQNGDAAEPAAPTGQDQKPAD